MNMKKLSYLAALVVAMTAVSCVQDINEGAPVADNGATTFTASFDAAAASKAVLKPGETESKVEWEAGDQVSVLTGEANYLYTANAGGATTTLTTQATDVPAEGAFYAVYPYDADAALAEGVITTVLPAEQTAVKGSFATHLAVAQAAENKLAFKNVCGLVKVNIAAAGVTKVVLEGNSGEVVAGAINVTVGAEPSWTAVEGQGATSVALVSATALEAGDYFFAVLPQTFAAGFKVTAYKGEESWVIRNVVAETTIARAGIVGGKSFFEIEGNGTEANPYILKTPEHLVGMRSLATLKGETWFKMANDIDMKDVTNYLPVNYDQNFERKIHFDGDNHTISNFTYDKDVNGGNYASLFGVLYGSCKNLKVHKATIKSSNACGVLGGYVGTNNKPAEVENVTVTESSVSGTGDRAGGIAGQTVGSTFTRVSFQGVVTSTVHKSTVKDDVFTASSANAGGMAGLATGTSTFTECSTDVTISGKDSDFAGFIGQVQGTATFTDCSTKAIVNIEQEQKFRAAGFVGYSNATATYTRCKVLEGSEVNDISGRTSNVLAMVGGFVGYAGGTSVTAEGCSVNVNMNLPYGQSVGGFVGNAGTGVFKASNCSVAGVVNGANQVAGFIAYQEAAATVEISSSYSTAPVTGTGHYTCGFAGWLMNAEDKPIKMTDCYATGTVESKGSSCAGFLGRAENNCELTRCYATGNVTAVNNVAGLLGYQQAGTATLTGCHYDGETLTASGSAGGIVGTIYTNASAVLTGCYSSGALKATASHVAGIMGAASGVSHSFTDCYTTMDVYTTAGTNVGAIVGSGVGTISMTNCYAQCDVESDHTSSNNGRVGGLVGRHMSDLMMTGCHYEGTVKGKYYVGGLIGYSEGKEAKINKCYAQGTILYCDDSQTTGRYHGGFIGASSGANSKVSIENSWSTMSVYGEQFLGGMIGAFEGTQGLTVKNCYTDGCVKGRGIGGIVGRVTKTATITKCIVWDATMTSTRTGGTQYASGAITGSVTAAGNYSACYRNPSMVYTDVTVPLVDHEDVVNAKPAAPAVGAVDDNQYAYHGKAVAAGSTISSVAKTLGWDETVWDLSGDVPTLK